MSLLIGGSCKLVGVLGGMGPEATITFLSKVVAKTPANKDQDHIPMVILNNTKIPDRTRSVLNHEDRVLEFLIDGINFLIHSNVDLIAIPCVSSHFYYKEMARASSVPVLNIIDETVSSIVKKDRIIENVGILGTTLTIRERLLAEAFERVKIGCIVPQEETQQRVVMAAIYLVKGGEKRKAEKLIGSAVSELAERGAEVIVAGCTELPLIMEEYKSELPVVDTLDCLAEAVVREAIYKE